MLEKNLSTHFFNFLAFTLTLFYKNDINLHTHTHTYIYHYFYKVISITLKEHIFSNCFGRVWRRNRLESCLSFKVWTHGFDKRDLRELPSSFLKRKESKVRGENYDFAWIGGNGKASWMFVLTKVKEEVRWSLVIAWPTKSWSLGVNMHETLALCVEFQLVACGWNFHYKISCIICLIKIPTMYLIT